MPRSARSHGFAVGVDRSLRRQGIRESMDPARWARTFSLFVRSFVHSFILSSPPIRLDAPIAHRCNRRPAVV